MNEGYGQPPKDMGAVDCSAWTEFMHYLYLPVTSHWRYPAVITSR
jgi:hypothetical protein